MPTAFILPFYKPFSNELSLNMINVSFLTDIRFFFFSSSLTDGYGQTGVNSARPATAYGFRPDEQFYYGYTASR